MSTITDEVLEEYFTGRRKNEEFIKLAEEADKIKVHADGVYPKKMIEQARPGEDKKTKDYRELIFKAVTKLPFNRILTELQKIRKSEEWGVIYDTSKVSSTLTEGERLSDYCEKNYPGFGSITNWAFQVLLKKKNVDPSGVITVIPKTFKQTPTEGKFLKPIAYIFETSQVLEFVEDDYCILKSKEKSKYLSADGKATLEGDIFYVIDTERVQRWEETTPVGGKRTFHAEVDEPHNLGVMPAFQIGAIVKEIRESFTIYESRMEATCIQLDEAAREYSDLQAEVVRHLNSTAWIITNQDCTNCGGDGKILVEGEDPVVCPTCKGSCKMPASPYQYLQINPAGVGEQQIPTPPMGYVEKSTNIVEIQDKRIDAHVFKGLCAVGMGHLNEVPLATSGTSKAYDRDGADTFCNSEAEDIVRVMDKVYFFINEYRNRVIIPDKKVRLEQLPAISVPEHFGYMHSEFMIDNLTKVKEAKLHPALVVAMELKYASSEFNANPEIRKRLEMIYTLDPFPGVGDDEKSSRLMNGGINKQDYILSSNIQQFIDRAIDEKPGFLKMKKKEQLVVLTKFAEEQLKDDTAAAAVTSGLEDEETETEPKDPEDKGGTKE